MSSLGSYRLILSRRLRAWPATMTARLDQLRAARYTAVVRLRVDLGLSSGAVARLDIEDVDRQGRKLWIRGRGHLVRESRTLPEPTLAALEDWLEVRRTVASVNETAVFVMLSGRSRGHRVSAYNLDQVAAPRSASTRAKPVSSRRRRALFPESP